MIVNCSEDLAMSWMRQMLSPIGPLLLFDAEGRSWLAKPLGSRFSYALSPLLETVPAAKLVPECKEAELIPPLRVHALGYSLALASPTYAMPKSELLLKKVEVNYSLLRKLGHGSFGQVWLARTKSNELVAVKRAHKGTSQQLMHEAAVLGELRHGCIVACLDFYLDTSAHAYLVLKLARGTLLESLTAPVSLRLTLRTLDSVRAGLQALHALGYVHLDLSPKNVLVYHDNSIKLADLGSCQREGEELRDMYVGTRKYRAPEILLGARRVDRRMDWWSLGILALEMAVRSERCMRGEDSLQQLLFIVALLGPPRLHELEALLPGWEPSKSHLHVADSLATRVKDAQRSGSDGMISNVNYTELDYMRRIGDVIDEAAFELALPLLQYDPAARQAGLRSWSRLMRQLKAPLPA